MGVGGTAPVSTPHDMILRIICLNVKGNLRILLVRHGVSIIPYVLMRGVSSVWPLPLQDHLSWDGLVTFFLSQVVVVALQVSNIHSGFGSLSHVKYTLPLAQLVEREVWGA